MQYSIAKDRSIREIVRHKRYNTANVIFYAFSVAQDIEVREPKNFAEVKTKQSG